MNDLTNEAKELFNEMKGFIKDNNFEVIEVRENYCKLKGIITESSKNHLDICHGGYIFGLADTCGGIAAMTDYRVGVTVNSSISFIKKARGTYLIAETNKISVGKKISVFEVNVYDEKEILVAKVTLTYSYIENATIN